MTDGFIDEASLFGDLDIASANDEPWAIKAGSYPCTVTTSEVKPSNDGSKMGWNLCYTVDEDDPGYPGFPLYEWKWIPTKADIEADANANRTRNFLAERMASLGIARENRNRFRAADALGAKVIVTIIVKDERPQIRKVVLNRPAGVRGSGDMSGLDVFKPNM